jgi:hypothetical protein
MHNDPRLFLVFAMALDLATAFALAFYQRSRWLFTSVRAGLGLAFALALD